MFDRIEELIGKNNLELIKSKKILLVGVGGVGGFAFEALIRTGFSDITIIDFDIVEISNINRQLVADLSTINMKKVMVLKERAKRINPHAHITSLDYYINDETINNLDFDYDYIIDACDNLKAKFLLIKFAINNNIKIISSMGVGNRVDATQIEEAMLSKTYNDPLAKKLRKMLKDDGITKDIPVIFSKEMPQKKENITSLITTPSISGIYLVNYIIKDIINL